MNRKFSPKVKKIISLSRSEALRLGHDYIGTEHLLLGMLQDNDNLAVRVLDAMDVDFTELKFKIEDTIAENRTEQVPSTAGNVPLNRQAERVLKVTFLEAKNLNSDESAPSI
jgi:ATP-dependent Clp protease ATP-binding subunit ClpC